MKSTLWTTAVDATTVVWIGLFVTSFVVTGQETRDLCGIVMLSLLPVFVADLVFLYRKERDFKSFILKRWFDVLLVIPYFRIFRVLRFARLLKVLRLMSAKKALGATRFMKKSRRTASAVGRLKRREPNHNLHPIPGRTDAVQKG